MRKVIFAMLIISVLLLLVACESKTTGKRVAIPERQVQAKAPAGISGAVTVQAQTGETGTSAADALKDLQSTGTAPVTGGSKSGTFYPPVTTDSTGKDALKEKTRALMSTGAEVPTTVKADDQFGARYHDSDGDSTNLPDGYSDNKGD